MCWRITAAALVPLNGGWPASISKSTQPSAYWSVLASGSASAAACSGLM